MKNVKSVCQNPQKFVNYTKNTTNEKSPKQRQILPRISKPPINEEKVESEDGICVEYIDESLELQNSEIELPEPTDLVLCRLCALDSSELVEIFNEQGQFYEDTECLRLMPQGLIEKDDGGPQLVCQTCLEKLQSCANIIDGFVMNQNLFAT